MTPGVECGLCLLKWVYERALAGASAGSSPTLLAGIRDALLAEAPAVRNIGQWSNRATDFAFATVPGAAGRFGTLKRRSTRAALDLLPAARAFVAAAPAPRERFERACAVAALGNVAPLGVPSQGFDFSELSRFLRGDGPAPATLGDAFALASRAAEVLLFADNAGEVAFDGLVVEALKDLGARVTLVVKEGEFFEDATAEDAHQEGLGSLADRILPCRAFPAPQELGGELAEALRRCDLVIAKGTGNYEALRGELGQTDAIYLLKVKCGPIARELGTPPGCFAVVADARLGTA